MPGGGEWRASLGGAPGMGYPTRLALAERALAEMTVRRDEALEKLTAVRKENKALHVELECSRSYQALYDAAQKVGESRRSDGAGVRFDPACVRSSDPNERETIDRGYGTELSVACVPEYPCPSPPPPLPLPPSRRVSPDPFREEQREGFCRVVG